MIPVTNGSSGAVAIVATMKAVQITAARSGNIQPATSATNVIGADSVRRRLSIIFQRPIGGIDDRPSRGCAVSRVGTVRAAQDPRQQLPVAASPSMLPRGGDVVARRKLLDQFDVRDQARARESSFEKIVTQQRVVGNAARQRGLEHVDIVNPFAAVRAFIEQVLVNVGNGERVRVDAGGAREDALENRSVAAGRQ